MANVFKSSRNYLFLLLISFWPSLNFTSININQNLISLDIYEISFYLFLFVSITYFFLGLIFDKDKSTIILSAVIISLFLFGGYESLFISLFNTIDNSAIFSLVLCFISFLLLFFVLILLIKKYNFLIIIIFFISFLYLPTIVRLLINLDQQKLVSNISLEENLDQKKINNNKFMFNKFHNVYFIILDQYARKDILQNILNFDNTAFLNQLKKRDFFVSVNSHSNYNRTGLTLSTSFNMNYYTEVNTYNNYLITQNSKSHSIFKDNSYDFIFVESGGNSEIACSGKENYCIKSGNFGDDVALFIKMTPIWRLMRTQYFNIYRYFESLYVLTDLDHAIEMAILKYKDIDKKYFLFAHILSPHEPQRFNEDCSKYLVLNPELGHPSSSQYLTDLPCLNEQVIKTIDYILENDQTDPIILLQSDHGISHEMQGIIASDKLIRLKNLMTFKLPNNCKKYYYDTISPVNNMHLVFSCLTDKKPNFVKDKYFFTNQNKFELDEVTGYLN